MLFDIRNLERSQTSEVTFKVTQGHWYWRPFRLMLRTRQSCIHDRRVCAPHDRRKMATHTNQTTATNQPLH